jgi:hypothetical protein
LVDLQMPPVLHGMKFSRKKSPHCLTHTTSVAPAHRSSSRLDALPHPFGAVNNGSILNGELAQK